jgi:hypothetical protein
MDVLGQYHLNRTVRWEQNLFAKATATATTPASTCFHMLNSIVLAITSNTANTGLKNIYFSDLNGIIGKLLLGVKLQLSADP